jgi:conjugative transfer region protein TrbK
MREQHDPVRLIVQLGAITLLLATVALSVGALRKLAIPGGRLLTAEQQTSVDSHELGCCRTIDPEQRPVDEACRRLWAENRRRFFGLDHEAGRPSTTDAWMTCSPSSQTNSKVGSGCPTGSSVQKD